LYPRSVDQLRRQKEIKPLLNRIWANGLTALWDAVDLTLGNVYDKTRPTKIVVVSDGGDNSSTKTRTQVEAKFKEYPNIQMLFVQIGDMVVQNKEFIAEINAEILNCDNIMNIKSQVCQFVRVN